MTFFSLGRAASKSRVAADNCDAAGEEEACEYVVIQRRAHRQHGRVEVLDFSSEVPTSPY
jgi:hypothetical protein